MLILLSFFVSGVISTDSYPKSIAFSGFLETKSVSTEIVSLSSSSARSAEIKESKQSRYRTFHIKQDNCII